MPDDARIEFALDSFDLADGRLVVAGRWYGVTGRRFVRPVLEVDGKRRVIAVLDHKPWPAVEGAEWLAAFPHDGPAGPSRLQVAPDIAVELPPAGPEAGDGRPRLARLARAAPKPARRKRAEPDPLEVELEAMRKEKDDTRAETERLRAELDHTRREVERLTEDLGHARTDTDRLRTELSHVRAEANTLKTGQDQTQAKAESVEADVASLRADAQRARAERDAAKAELERARPLPPSSPYIAPRPMAFQDRRSGPSWQLRTLAALAVVAALLIVLQLVFGLF